MAHREAIRAKLESKICKDMRVIDWGSGSKPVFRYVQHENCEFTCVDKNPNLDRSIYGNHRLIRADIEEPQNFGTFHRAFAMEVLEHVTHPQVVLKNIYRSLVSQGLFIFSVPFMYPEHGEDDYLRYTRYGLQKLLEEAGFSSIKIEEIPEGYYGEAMK